MPSDRSIFCVSLTTQPSEFEAGKSECKFNLQILSFLRGIGIVGPKQGVYECPALKKVNSHVKLWNSANEKTIVTLEYTQGN